MIIIRAINKGVGLLLLVKLGKDRIQYDLGLFFQIYLYSKAEN